MALYIALSLLAVMFALLSSSRRRSAHACRVCLFIALGLLIAHQLAFRLSARLAHGKLAPSTWNCWPRS